MKYWRWYRTSLAAYHIESFLLVVAMGAFIAFSLLALVGFALTP